MKNSNIRSVKEGDTISLTEYVGEETRWVKTVWKVKTIYRHHVLTEAGSRRRCFSYGDLIKMGLEQQDKELEALRAVSERPGNRPKYESGA